MPIKNAIKDVIMMALASYDTASVIHTTTANARIASMRWPATGKSAGNGSSKMPIITRTAITRPMGSLAFAVAGVGVVAGAFMASSLCWKTRGA